MCFPAFPFFETHNPLETPGISPPTWGWPANPPSLLRSQHDFPTHVGMARACGRFRRQSSRFPHPRGDGPRGAGGHDVTHWISPPTWGWPASPRQAGSGQHDFPTHVGMARWGAFEIVICRRFPHPRGDGPEERKFIRSRFSISPPTWGWPVVGWGNLASLRDFPTHVGMARLHSASRSMRRGFPHPRGDGPALRTVAGGTVSISPPTWGWPGLAIQHLKDEGDFPTHVGMARISTM